MSPVQGSGHGQTYCRHWGCPPGSTAACSREIVQVVDSMHIHVWASAHCGPAKTCSAPHSGCPVLPRGGSHTPTLPLLAPSRSELTPLPLLALHDLSSLPCLCLPLHTLQFTLDITDNLDGTYSYSLFLTGALPAQPGRQRWIPSIRGHAGRVSSSSVPANHLHGSIVGAFDCGHRPHCSRASQRQPAA